MSRADVQATKEVLRHSRAQMGITVLAGMREIWAHKFRSLLTMLGIILGVASLVAMSALVAGMEKGAKEALIAIGGLQKIRVESQELPIEQRHLVDQAVGITMNDVHALNANAPLVTRLSPEMRLPATLSANGKSFRPWNTLGVWPVALEMSEHVVAHGRMFNELDDEEARSVCVIGTATRDELWGAPDDVGREIIPIGETIFINGVPFTIIGMFQHYESEQDRKIRELEKAKGPQPKQGVARSGGWGGRGRGGVYAFKNRTVYLPLNTVWMKFRAGRRRWRSAEVGPGATRTRTPPAGFRRAPTFGS
jgi:ABC-type antimicrobial peptide transport system permease subunit